MLLQPSCWLQRLLLLMLQWRRLLLLMLQWRRLLLLMLQWRRLLLQTPDLLWVPQMAAAMVQAWAGV
jgi:hypothetical protein